MEEFFASDTKDDILRLVRKKENEIELSDVYRNRQLLGGRVAAPVCVKLNHTNLLFF